MNNINLIPVFGTSFAVYIPLIMLIVALLTLFDGFGRIVKILGIEWEDASSDSHSGLSCTCRDRDKEIELDPQMQEKIRTGKLIVSNEIKQRRAAEQMLEGRNKNAHGAGSTGGGNDLSGRKPNVMRIGAPSSTHMTEALISHNPIYRNVVTSVDVDNDLELDGSDHQFGFIGGSGNAGGRSGGGGEYGRLSSVELGRGGGTSAADAARASLFSHGGKSGGGGTSATSSNSSGRSGISPTTRRPAAAAPDLFSISNDEAINPYAGRYSNV